MLRSQSRVLPLFFVWLSVGILVFLALSTASAEQQNVDDEYEEHFRRGVELYRGSDYEGALTEFDWAYRLRPHAEILLNMAYCYSEMGRIPEAIEHFERYISESDDEVSETVLIRAERELSRLRALVVSITVTVNVEGATVLVDGQEVGTSPLADPIMVRGGAVHVFEARLDGFRTARQELNVAANTEPPPVALELERNRTVGDLRIECSVEGAEVFINNENVGSAPFEGELSAGTHMVRVEADGYSARQREVALAAGDRRTITMELELAGAPARLSLDMPIAGAQVFVDGEPVGTTPLEEPLTLSPGPHRLRIEHEEYANWSGDVVLEQGELTTAEAELARNESGMHPAIFYSFLGFACASAIGSLVMGLLTINKNNELESFLSDVEAERATGPYINLENHRQELQDSGRLFALTTDILWISASVFGVTALIMAFFTRFGPEESSVQFGGSVIQKGAVFSTQVRF